MSTTWCSSRFVDRTNPCRILIYVDGACLNNGRPNARAGWGIVYGEERTSTHGYPVSGRAFGRLENRGPSGEEHPQTSNRAELRAVLVAIESVGWIDQDVRTLVLATDSEYVAYGCTQWVYDWERNGWQTSEGRPVANQDLWKALLETFRTRSREGLEVRFWRIPREWNTMADQSARLGAEKDEKLWFSKVFED